MRRDFTILIPAYNEALVVPDLVRELHAVFSKYRLDGEVLLVDDGSTDGTADLAEKEAADWERFQVVRHKVNRGKTEAILTAAEHASEGLLILFDADLQYSPAVSYTHLTLPTICSV